MSASADLSASGVASRRGTYLMRSGLVVLTTSQDQRTRVGSFGMLLWLGLVLPHEGTDEQLDNVGLGGHGNELGALGGRASI
jgi:hypothetical protein